MSKRNSSTANTEVLEAKKAETTEIIELAINDISVLAKAFNLITEISENTNISKISVDSDTDKFTIN